MGNFGQTVTTEYVIKIVETDIGVRKGGFAIYNIGATGGATFPFTRELERATRFKSQLAAAQAVEHRNGSKNSNTSERYAILPVTVTVTPATSKPKTETVPGKKGFVLSVKWNDGSKGYIYFSGTAPTIAGSASYSNKISDAHLFESAAEAGAWIGYRLAGRYATITGTPVMELYTTPATTKYIDEVIPASTTVSLA